MTNILLMTKAGIKIYCLIAGAKLLCNEGIAWLQLIHRIELRISRNHLWLRI